MALTYTDITSKTNKFIVPRMVDEVNLWASEMFGNTGNV